MPDIYEDLANSYLSGSGSKAESLRKAASKLRIDPVDLGSIISFETGGTLDPHKVGGEGNKYRGLIQFGPAEQKKYYRPGQSFDDQVNDGVVRYFQDRFKKAGKRTDGATLQDLYTTVIAGNPNANRNAKDAFGTSANSGVQKILNEHRPKVLKDIFGGENEDTYTEAAKQYLDTPDPYTAAASDYLDNKGGQPIVPTVPVSAILKTPGEIPGGLETTQPDIPPPPPVAIPARPALHPDALLGQALAPLVKKQIKAAQQPKPVKTSTSVSVGQEIPEDATPLPNGGYVRTPKVVGKPTDDPNGIVVEYAPPPQEKNAETALRDAMLAAGHGVTPQQADDFVAKTKAQYGGVQNDPMFKGWKPGTPITISWNNLRQAGVTDTQIQNRMEQAQNPVDLPPTDVISKNTAELLNKNNGLRPENIKEAIDNAPTTFGEPERFLARNTLAGIVGGAGHTANFLSGALNIIEDLNPQRGDSMREATDLNGFQEANDALKAKGQPELTREQYIAMRGLPPETKSFLRQGGNFLTGVGRAGEDFQSKVGDKSLLGKGVQLLGNLTSDLPRMMILPGGAITNFAVDSAAQVRGQGGSTKDVLKAAGQGALLGALGKFAEPFAKGVDTGVSTLLNKSTSPLLQKGVELASVASGVYATSRAFGDSPDAAFDNAVLMSALHLHGLLGRKAENKGIEFRDEKGNAVKVEIKDGKVQTTDKPTEIRVAVPEDAKAALKPNETKLPQSPAPMDKTPLVSDKPVESKTVTHPDEAINGKPIVAETRDGKVVVPNENNKSRVSIVKNRETGFDVVAETGPQAKGVGRLKQQRDEARRTSETDPLTGLANRAALDKALPTAEADPNTSVIAFDANNFGKINKEVGQAEGDKALQDIASAIKQAAKEFLVGGREFRRGGDEFVVLAPKDVADRVRARAEEIYGDKKYGSTNVSLSGTVGDNFKEADSTLQEAKAKRKAAPEKVTGELPVPKGMVRMYHGGTEYDNGPRWLTPDKAYAEGYAKKGNSSVHYVDIPEESPYLKKSYDDSGVRVKAPYLSFEAPEEIAKGLKKLEPATISEPPAPSKSEIKTPVKTRPEKAKSLSEFVRSLGGIKPTGYDKGEAGRISNKETGTSGLVNKNSTYTADRMAEAAWEAGYLRNEWESIADRNSNDFMGFVENDLHGIQKHYIGDEGVEAKMSLEDQEALSYDNENRRKHLEQRLEYLPSHEHIDAIGAYLKDDRVRAILTRGEHYGFSGADKIKLHTIGRSYDVPAESVKVPIGRPQKETSASEPEGARNAGGDGGESIYGDAYEPPGAVDTSFNPADFEKPEVKPPNATNNPPRVTGKGDTGTGAATKRGNAGTSDSETPAKAYGTKNTLFTTDRAERARQTLAKKLGGTQLNAGLDPEIIKAAADLAGFHIEAGARKFADFSAKMIQDVGEQIRPYLKSLYDQVRDEHGFEGMESDVPSASSPTALKNSIVDAERKARGLPLAMKAARQSFGTVWDKAMAKVEESPSVALDLVADLKQKPRAITDEENAILLHHQIDLRNRYDQIATQLAKAVDSGDKEAAVEARVRLAPISDRLQDVYDVGKQAGTETARGLNARKMLVDEDFSLASLERQKRAANGGRKLTDDELDTLRKVADDYKTANEALEKHLADRESELAEIKGSLPPKRVLEVAKNIVNKLDTRADAARERIKKRGNVFTAGLDPIALKDLAEIGASHIANAGLDFVLWSERMIGEFGEKVKPHLNDVWDKANRIIDGLDPAIRKQVTQMSDERRLKAWKTRASNRIDELTTKIVNEDYSPRPKRPPIVLDEEGLKLKADLERVKQKFQKDLKLDQYKNRPATQRAMDSLAKWTRSAMLSSPVTIAKLAAAAAERMAFTPMEQVVGSVYSAIFPRLAAKVTRQAGFNVKAEAAALREGFTKGIDDAWKTIKTGTSDLAAVFGSDNNVGRNVLDWFGSMHAALKAPAKRNEFARSFEMRVSRAIDAGVDVTNPEVQSAIAIEAYKDANAAIFQQDNYLATKFKRLFSAEKDKSGNIPLNRKAWETFGKVLFPIVKVPTNIVKETGVYAGGSVSGTSMLIKAYMKGIDNLKPEDAETIMRHLKKGSLGLAALSLGYANPQAFGGYYQAGQKRDEKDVKYGSVRIFGQDIPSFLVHNPLLETFQIGATIRRVSDSRKHKDDEETEGLATGLIEAAAGLVEEVPFVRETANIGELLDPRTRSKAAGDFFKARAIPQVAQYIAQKTDRGAEGEVKRKPQGFVQSVEMGIPGLRQNVPTKEPQVSDSERKLIQDIQMKGQAMKAMDIIEHERAAGRDTTDYEDRLKDKLDRKSDNGTLTQEEADRANDLLGLKGRERYEADTSGVEAPKLPRVSKDAQGIIDKAILWGEALGTDPVQAFNKFTAGETIRRLENGTIIVERMSKDASESVKRRRGGGKTLRLDHTVPLEIGGTNEESNLQLVSIDDWERYTPVENALANALHDNKVSGEEARQLITDFKSGKITEKEVMKRIQ